MVLFLDKPTVCKDCQSRSISRKKRPSWLKLVTSGKRLYRCDIFGWTAWVQGKSASSASDAQSEFPSTEFASTEYPETVTRNIDSEDTKPLVPDQVSSPMPDPVVQQSPTVRQAGV